MGVDNSIGSFNLMRFEFDDYNRIYYMYWEYYAYKLFHYGKKRIETIWRVFQGG